VKEVQLTRLFDGRVGERDVDHVARRGDELLPHRVAPPHRLVAALIELLDRGHRVTPEQYAKARERRDEYRQWFDNMFERFDGIVTLPRRARRPRVSPAPATIPSTRSGRSAACRR
jgi:hypothetical protein